MWPKEVPSTERDGQIGNHGQNLEVTYNGTKSSPPPPCVLQPRTNCICGCDANQEMVMGLKNSHLIRLKPEHINHWFGMALCKHVSSALLNKE